MLAPGALTEISLSQIMLDKTAGNADVEAFGDTYQVLVKSQGIQADGFSDAETALKEGFGDITATENIPFDNDSPTEGIDLRTALHNLNGDTNNPITAKVAKVTYGLNREYPQIVDGYEGTLVDVEQDVDVYAYYVPNGSNNYDVYFLADDTIYSPKQSDSLYMDMTALETVDTHNYDVSRTEDMYAMFAQCGKLNDIDLSDWDTSNVTNMSYMFQKCNALEELDLAGWNVEKVETLKYFAYSCVNLKNVDLSGWNVASACDATYMLSDNPVLEEINATGMKTAGITDASFMFQNNKALNNIIGEEGWTFPNVTKVVSMFRSCTSLTYVDATNWDMGSCSVARKQFMSCTALETVEGTENWDTSNITSMYAMFYGDGKLKDLDVSTWDTSSCTDMSFTFGLCYELPELDVSNWDTGMVTTMYSMFQQCEALEELDVSNWDVSQVTTFGYMFKAKGNTGNMKIKELAVSDWDTGNATDMMCMFYGCGQLTSVDMSGWNTANLENISHMFADCYKLEKVDFTGWETPKLNTVDALFNHCKSLKSVDVSSLDTTNVVEFSQAFEYCISLEEIIGLDKWVTTSGQDFGEMFANCSSLKVLDLSSFDTTKAKDSYVNASNGDGNDRFHYFLTGCNSLEKITLGKNFSFDGDGSFTKWTFEMPSATNVDGWDGNWYNAETGVAYLPGEVPEETAATYVAVNPVNP